MIEEIENIREKEIVMMRKESSDLVAGQTNQSEQSILLVTDLVHILDLHLGHHEERLRKEGDGLLQSHRDQIDLTKKIRVKKLIEIILTLHL